MKILSALCAALALLIAYRVFTAPPPKTAPLTYTRGAVASSRIRQEPSSRSAGADPLNVFLARREDQYPGVIRDIFRMDNPATKPKLQPQPEPQPVPIPEPEPQPVITVPAPPPVPAPPEKTPEEIAEQLSREDLSKFRFLGYLTEKDNTLFLSKEGELFMVKSGDAILQHYRIREAGKDFVVLFDMLTRVEVRIELSGSEPGQPAPQPRGR